MEAKTFCTADDLHTLNEIVQTLNRASDVRSVLDTALERLVELIGLRTGWIFLIDEEDQNLWAGRGYRLAAHVNLPPALALEREEAWRRGCDCQQMCREQELPGAYNEVRCSRLRDASGEKEGLLVHASVPLRAGSRTLGILNVAAPDWSVFNEGALALLTNVGVQMGSALERAQLFDLVQEKRLHEQRSLLDFTNQLLSNRRLSDLLDFLVTEVRRLMGVDACAVLLPDPADPEQLYFAAAAGWFHDPVAAGRRVPAGEKSGSGRSMLHREPLVITEVKEDARLPWTREWLTAEGFESAAIMPLVAGERAIGTLVVDSRQPQQFISEQELRFLQVMANQAAIAIQTTRLHEEDIARQRMEDELQVGRTIQLSMLPSGCPLVPGWDLCTFYEAARQVGGDFYDFYHLPDPSLNGGSRLGLLVADVADKGVPAALFMVLSRTMLRNVAYLTSSPGATLRTANDLLIQDSQTDLFLTAFYGVLDTATGRFTYANGGHNRPLLYRAASGEWEELATSGIALGVLPQAEIPEAETEIRPGDVLVIYTDGVTEAMDMEMVEFGLERMKAAIGDPAGVSASVVQDRVVAAVSNHMGEQPQWDDFTLLVAKRAGI